MHVFDRIALGRLVAPAFLGEHMDYHWAGEPGRVGQSLLHLGHVVAVERTQVGDAQSLEECRRFEHLPEGRLRRTDPAFEKLANPGHALGKFLQASLSAHVDRVGPDADQALREPADRRGVGPTVVVEDDRDSVATVAEVVEAFEGQSSGQGAVADDRDYPAVVVAGCTGYCQSVGVGQHG